MVLRAHVETQGIAAGANSQPPPDPLLYLTAHPHLVDLAGKTGTSWLGVIGVSLRVTAAVFPCWLWAHPQAGNETVNF